MEITGSCFLKEYKICPLQKQRALILFIGFVSIFVGIVCGNGGIVIDNDITFSELGNIRNGIAENIDLNKTEALFQFVNIGDQVIINVNMGQRLKITQRINIGQHIVRAVNGL